MSPQLIEVRRSRQVRVRKQCLFGRKINGSCARNAVSKLIVKRSFSFIGRVAPESER